MERLWRVVVAAVGLVAVLGTAGCDKAAVESTVTVFGQVMLNLQESTLSAHGLTGQCEGVGLASGVEVGTSARILTQDGQVVAQGVIVRSEGSEVIGGCRLYFEIEGLPVVPVETGGYRELRAVTDRAYDVSIGSQVLENIPAQTLVDLHLDLRLTALRRVLYVNLSEGGPAVTFP